MDEAKKFYPLFGLGANVALIFSGRTVKYFSNLRKNLGPGVDGWALSLKGMMSIVVLMGLIICALYWWVNAYVPLPTRSKKKKVSFKRHYFCTYVLDMFKQFFSWKTIENANSFYFILFGKNILDSFMIMYKKRFDYRFNFFYVLFPCLELVTKDSYHQGILYVILFAVIKL